MTKCLLVHYTEGAAALTGTELVANVPFAESNAGIATIVVVTLLNVMMMIGAAAFFIRKQRRRKLKNKNKYVKFSFSLNLI